MMAKLHKTPERARTQPASTWAPNPIRKRKLVDYPDDKSEDEREFHVDESNESDTNVRVTLRRPVKRRLTDEEYNSRDIILAPPSPIKAVAKMITLTENYLEQLRLIYGEMSTEMNDQDDDSEDDSATIKVD